MIREQKRYLLVCLAITSIMLFAVNIYADVPLTRVMGYIKFFASLYLLFTLIILIRYFFKKTFKAYKLALATLTIFLVINLGLVTTVVNFEMAKYEMFKIEKMNTCEKAGLQFKADLKNEDMKFFIFGIGVDEEYMLKVEQKYNLKVYHMGCMVSPSYQCYNELVKDHLKKGRNEEFD